MCPQIFNLTCSNCLNPTVSCASSAFGLEVHLSNFCSPSPLTTNFSHTEASQSTIFTISIWKSPSSPSCLSTAGNNQSDQCWKLESKARVHNKFIANNFCLSRAKVNAEETLDRRWSWFEDTEIVSFSVCRQHAVAGCVHENKIEMAVFVHLFGLPQHGRHFLPVLCLDNLACCTGRQSHEQTRVMPGEIFKMVSREEDNHFPVNIFFKTAWPGWDTNILL